MASGGPSSMPFGYAFEDAFNQQDPRHTPSGPPLLSDSENSMMGNFWNNPDTAAFATGNDSLFAFDFGGEQQDATSLFAPEVLSNQYTQHIAGQTFHPLPNQNPPQTDPSSDDGSIIAEALMSMSYNGPSMQRPTSRRPPSQTPNEYAPNVLNAVQYTPDHSAHLANHGPLHAPSMSSFHRASNAQPWNATTRPPMIPNGLPFDTDQAFTTSGSRPLFNPRAASDSMLKSPHDDLENHAFLPYIDHSPNFFDHSVKPPSYINGKIPVQRNSVGASPDLAHNIQAAKRMRIEPIRGDSSPAVVTRAAPAPDRDIKGEGSHRESSVSSGSENGSASPAMKPNGAIKRRQKLSSNTPVGKAAAGGKRQKLSSEQRKRNHIESEKRRRGEMQRGYAALDKLVPSLKSVGLSKAQVLQHTVVFLDALIKGNERVQTEIARRQSETTRQGRRFPVSGSG